MNKTVNINIGGLVFHIDEDAYQKLSRYFDAIKRSLSNSSGKDEIMKDIEMRVAELFSERQKSDKHVINMKDVDEVVTVMGQPEDYRIDDDSSTSSSDNFTNNYTSTKRKLYRDKDNGSVAGVCTGLGYYFGIDAVWIKIVFLIFVFAGFGTGILAYFILWFVTPEAKTTTEKLEMTGEPVNISNIEKKVREEFENVSNKFKSVDYDKMGNQIKSSSNEIGNKLGNAASSVFGAFAKVLGALIVVFAGMSLFAIAIASIILMFSSTLPENTIINNMVTPLGLDTPLWQQGLLFLFVVGVPLFFLLYLGLKLLVTNLKSIGNVAKYMLLALWIIAIGILASLAVNEVTKIAYDGKDVKKETLNLAPTDTLQIKFVTNDFFEKDVNYRTDLRLTQDENNNKVIYSNNVYLKIMPTSEKLPYLQVEKLAVGKSPNESKNRAEKIKYNFKFQGNQLILDNYLISDVASKIRNQKVELYLYLPEGILLKSDSTLENYDYSDNDYFNFHFDDSDKYTYKVENNKIKCLNCPADDNEYNDVETNNNQENNKNDSTKSVILNINGKDVITKTTDKQTSTLTIGKDGIIIKTK